MSSMIAETKFENLFSKSAPLELDCGKTLSSVRVAYQSLGELNTSKDNVIMVNHALTGNAHIAGVANFAEIANSKNEEFLSSYNRMYDGKKGWWSPLIGPGKALDTDKYFIICSNVLGSCYGTSGPSSTNNNSGLDYRLNFPKVSVRDMVKVQKELFNKLGIEKVELAIGGSLGGMQIFEWAIMYGDMVNKIMPIGASVGHSPWAIALNEASRNAIMNDPVWDNGNYSEQPELGLSLARKIAMITYRSYESFSRKFGRDKKEENLFEVESYLNYQGGKITKRFDANSYIYLSEAMDNHDVGEGRNSIANALSMITCKTEIVGISSDILYPVDEQKKIAALIPNATYSEIESIHGHDAFLIEFEQVDKIIRNFLN